MTISYTGQQFHAAHNVWTSPSGLVMHTGAAVTGVPLPDLERKPWHGGPAYFSYFTNPGPLASPSVYPVFEFYGSFSNNSDATAEKSYGVQGSIRVTQPTDMQIYRDTGLYAFPFPGEYTGTPDSSPGGETVGWFVNDEPDLGYGPGWSNTTVPPEGFYQNQQVAAQFPADNNAAYTNYSVAGILFFESQSDAAVFVNGGDNLTLSPTPPDNWRQTIVSADLYFYAGTANDNNMQTYAGLAPDQCARSYNYGWVIDKIRALQSVGGYNTGPKPVWSILETGHPYTDGTFILPAQFNGACWASVIHDAAGITLFYQNFINGNTDPAWSAGTQYHLYDNVWYAAGSANYCACYGTPTLGVPPPSDPAWQLSVTNFVGVRANLGATGMAAQIPATIAQIQSLATVINTQTLLWSFHPDLDTCLKAPGDGFAYIFAMQGLLHDSGTYTLTLPPGVTGTTVTVIDESRTLSVSGGQFTDSFAAEYTVHLYKVAI